MAAVQTCTVPAPSAMNSAASRQVVIPPMAEIGRPAQAGSRAISDTIDSAIGLTAGPHMPPCVPLPSMATSGVMASRSMFMIELMVLMSDTASPPPFFAARAGWRTSVILGVSLTITGMRVCALHQRATISTYSGTCPTAEPMPRSDMPCGQPKLSSTPSHSVSSTRARMACHDCSSQGTISDTMSARSGQARLTSLISRRLISRSRSVMSSMLFIAISRRSGPWMAP